MSRHHGQMVRTVDGWTQGEPARAVRRREALIRNALTPTERTAWFRKQRERVHAQLGELLGAGDGDGGAVVLDRRQRRRLSGREVSS